MKRGHRTLVEVLTPAEAPADVQQLQERRRTAAEPANSETGAQMEEQTKGPSAANQHARSRTLCQMATGGAVLCKSRTSFWLEAKLRGRSTPYEGRLTELLSNVLWAKPLRR